MIPDFNKFGSLPEGIHHATINEAKRRFAVFDRSDRRIRLFDRLEQLFAEAKASGIVRHVQLAGSFITNKPEPNDFDCILVIDPVILGRTLLPREYNLVSRQIARRLYGGDVVPVIDGSVAHYEYLEFFRHARDGRRVGILEVEL
jgi:hypothetical protein